MGNDVSYVRSKGMTNILPAWNMYNFSMDASTFILPQESLVLIIQKHKFEMFCGLLHASRALFCCH
ncbi:protein BCCIP-like protein [Iris pallida]|uniref:Protein BCCIP-like protein n=1 Tax=Iris pallida TaxID=29817 RepID=A0AAX6EZZ9_IRIPA|nr:protein BCCIP-like protein [Iris pallida]